MNIEAGSKLEVLITKGLNNSNFDHLNLLEFQISAFKFATPEALSNVLI